MENNHKKLYIAAKKLFSIYSPKKVTIDMIVQEAELGKWTFYNYFQHKEDIYEQIVENYISKMSDLKDKEKFDYEDISHKLIVIFVGTAISAFEDNIIKNFFLRNDNFFIGKVDYSFLRSHHKKSMKKYLRSEFSDTDIDLLSELIWIYTKTMIEKESLYTQRQLEQFSIEFASILVKGFYSDYNSSITINYKDIKNKINCYKKTPWKN